MIPRRLMAFSVYALPVLIVAFGVAMGGFLLLSALDDQTGQKMAKRIGGILAGLIVLDSLVLVTILGIRELERTDDQP